MHARVCVVNVQKASFRFSERFLSCLCIYYGQFNLFLRAAFCLLSLSLSKSVCVGIVFYVLMHKLVCFYVRACLCVCICVHHLNGSDFHKRFTTSGIIQDTYTTLVCACVCVWVVLQSRGVLSRSVRAITAAARQSTDIHVHTHIMICACVCVHPCAWVTCLYGML